MKTQIKYIAVLLAFGALASCQKDPATAPADQSAEKTTIANGQAAQAKKTLVQYQVIVALTSDVTPCGAYLVAITNSAGANMVAPQPWSSGKDKYLFSEPARTGMGVRIAKLIRILPPNTDEFCPNRLWATPDWKNLDLSDGVLYTFTLSVNINTND